MIWLLSGVLVIALIFILVRVSTWFLFRGDVNAH